MQLRTLFSEMPYAAAVKESELLIRCSTCFAKKASTPCKEGCGVVYCSDECQAIDSQIHRFECLAFRQLGSTDIDDFVRLLGRILTRLLVDDGVAHLADNFPENVPDRRFSDLLSHQTEIEGCKRRLAEMEATLSEFRAVFKNTPLVGDFESVRRTYCIMWINCFSVGGPYNMTRGHGSSVGLGFYMNTSRFNHGCRPDLCVDFDGALLIIRYPSDVSDDAAVIEERSRLTRSAEEFDALTINYGFSHSFSNGSYFPLRCQRRASLQFGYYFDCHCVLCDDQKEAVLEEHAAALECSRCGEPYVWTKVARRPSIMFWQSGGLKISCRKICSCPSTTSELAAAKKFKRSLRACKMLSVLEDQWAKAMCGRMRDRYASQLVADCEPVLNQALKFWHPSRNLRLAQLCERVFVSYNVLVAAACKTGVPPDTQELKAALDTGEVMMAWCERHPNIAYTTVLAAYANDMARLYEVATLISDSIEEAMEKFDRAAYWYLYAASIWQSLGEKAAAFIVKLNASAENAKKAAAECVVESAEPEEAMAE